MKISSTDEKTDFKKTFEINPIGIKYYFWLDLRMAFQI